LHVLKNFKNFAEAELNLLKPLTLMIGRNGSGKSNVIEAVELLAQLAHGRPLYEITDIGRGGGSTFEVRGGLPGCLKYDQTDEIAGVGQFSLEFYARFNNTKFRYHIAIKLTPQPKISEEFLVWGRRNIFAAIQGKREDILDVTYDNFKKGGNPTTHLPSDCSVLSRYESFANLDGSNDGQKDASKLVRLVEKHLNAAFVFDLNPKLMRNYERIGQRLLLRDGSNLSSVLYGLSRNDKQQATLNRILESLKQLPEEPFEDFEFVKTKLNDVILAFRRSNNTLADARLLSDGSLRALAILTALETVPASSRIVIEEMDNGIHPSRVDMLVNYIWDCSKRRKLNVLATTHNPATLDCLSSEQLESVVLCYYDYPSNTSHLIPLTDLPRAEVLLERGSLGDLVTRRVLEQHLTPNFDEDQKRKAQAWLESLT